jgi:hypothetical protein
VARYRNALPLFAAAWLALLPACVCARVATQHPSSDRPDQVVLTFTGDPRSSLAVSWRQSPAGAADRVEVRSRVTGDAWSVRASCQPIDSGRFVAISNDKIVQRCSAELSGLLTDSVYEYRPAAPGEADATPWRSFRTAPEGPADPVSFFWFGDVQAGIDAWSRGYEAAAARHPEARFSIQVGDLVNLGARRADYDEVFAGAPEAFARLPFVPVLGNHEYFMGGDALFERIFVLSGTGPSGPGHCRAFDYGPVRVVVLDSTPWRTHEAQAAWLAERLDESRAPWKIVAFHHPVWPPRSATAAREVPQSWMDTIESRGVQLVLNGHDHSYMRTHPLRAGLPSPDGTVYAVSTSGSKTYRQEPTNVFAKGIADTPTYQVITATADRLVLSTRTWDGAEVDRWERTR